LVVLAFSREQGKAATQFFTQTKTVYFEPPQTPAPSAASPQAQKATGQMSA
jgi:hypothetical protein